MNKKAEKILVSTIAYFLRHGVHKITMDDIAGCAKVSKVTIYKYFTDKDTLYLKTAKYLYSQYEDRINEIADSGEALVKKLYEFMDAVGAFSISGHFKLCEELADYNSHIEPEHYRYIQTYKRCLQTLIDQGLSEGILKDGLNQETVYHYINMGFVYFQQNDEYRQLMNTNSLFRQQYLQFYISHIFADPEAVMPS